jgi:ribosomal protein S18 acetylase RimI-like enzyme
MKNEIAVGRIAAIIDHAYCKVTAENIGYFGFFECIQDYECAQVLFTAAEEWLIQHQMLKMRGPIDGRIDVGCGFLATGFDSPPSLLSTYTPAYYITFSERFGMKKVRDLFLYRIDLTRPLPPKLEEKARQSATSGVKLRPFNRLHTKKELSWWIDLFLETFSNHWGFVPVSAEEVKTRFGIKQLRWFVDSPLFLIAEMEGVPVAYLWSTPDYNQIFQKMHGRLGLSGIIRFFCTKQKIHAGKLHFIGIKKDYRNHNIGSYLNYAILAEMKKRGYTSAQVGWIDEQNTVAHTTIALTDATIYKRHHVFEKDLRIDPSNDERKSNEKQGRKTNQ